MALTRRQSDVLECLRSARRGGVKWCRQLVRMGFVERARRDTLMNYIGGGRGSYVYRAVK